MLSIIRSYAYMKKQAEKHLRKMVAMTKINGSLAFAAGFGLLMLVIGLSQLYAQSNVAFLLQPYSQSSNANEDKTLTINLTTSGQQVTGGSVKILYDNSKLSFVSFQEIGNPYIGITNRASSEGAYSFDYFISYGSQSNPDLGRVVFRTKSLSSQQAALLKFDAAGTRAFYESGSSSRAYYPSSYGQAAIVINAAPPGSTSPPPTAPPPTTSAPPTASPAPTRPTSPTTSGNPNNASRPPITPDSSGSPTNTTNSTLTELATGGNREYVEDGQNYVPPYAAAGGGESKRIAPIVLIALGVLLLGLAAGAYIYIKYIRDLPLGSVVASNLHIGIFDGKPAAETPADEIVIAPTLAKEPEPAINDEPAVSKPRTSIITKSKERLMRRRTQKHKEKAAEQYHTEPAVDESPDELKPKHDTKPELTPMPEALKKRHNHHNESKTVTVSLHPHDPSAHPSEVHVAPPPEAARPAAPLSAPPPQHAAGSEKPAAPPFSTPHSTVDIKPEHYIKPSPPPASPPPLMPVTAHNVQASLGDERSVQAPGHHIPDWQSQLKVPVSRKANEGDPPDMFELAHDHPESFGSAKLYEAETQEKENHDKTKKQ